MLTTKPKSFEEWQTSVSNIIRADPLWKSAAYQKALFLYDLSWFDCDYLMDDTRGRKLAGQLIQASSSISANIEEGFGKGLGPDYARYLSIALGSSRETRGWYWRARHKIPMAVVEHRMALASEIIALLATTIPQQRQIKRKK
ncbi:MAG: four helix bundle protein, partial [Anaerolineales bacterium]|nr:four helix bundle protein [Anaerolineales bacterium]